MASTPPSHQQNGHIHIIHHTFRHNNGKKRCAVSLASALRSMGRQVTVHTMKADTALASSLGIQLNLVPIPSFPRKLQTFRFFRAIERKRPQMNGLKISLSRVRGSDALICGGCHHGYLARTKKWSGPFDWLQLWMEHESCRSAHAIVAHSDLIAADLASHYPSDARKLRTLYAPLDERFTNPADVPLRTELRKKLGWPHGKVVFLFPSTGHRRKGLQPISKALERFSQQVI